MSQLDDIKIYVGVDYSRSNKYTRSIYVDGLFVMIHSITRNRPGELQVKSYPYIVIDFEKSFDTEFRTFICEKLSKVFCNNIKFCFTVDNKSLLCDYSPDIPNRVFWRISDLVDDVREIIEIVFTEDMKERKDGAMNIYWSKPMILLPEIEKVIYNDPATIIFWNDHTKTVVKCQDGDTYDPQKGFLLCFMKKMYGNRGKYNDVIKKYDIVPLMKISEEHDNFLTFKPFTLYNPDKKH